MGTLLPPQPETARYCFPGSRIRYYYEIEIQRAPLSSIIDCVDDCNGIYIVWHHGKLRLAMGSSNRTRISRWVNGNIIIGTSN